MRSSKHLKEQSLKFGNIPGYTYISNAGSGTFGAVFLAKDSNNRNVAVKKVFLDPHFKTRELQLVKQLNHPNTLEYITSFNQKEGENKFLILITSYLPMNLSQFMIKFPFPPVIYLKLIGFQIFSGLCYLHSHGVCHRDIKPANILIDSETGECQICDFGSAKFLAANEKSISYIGTRNYRAPELLLDCQTYSGAIDIWPAGCVLAELLLQGRPLFLGSSNMNLLLNITKIIGSPKPEVIDSFQHTKKFVYYNLPQVNSINSVLPQFTPPELIDLFQKIFVFNPHERLTASQCMEHPFFSSLFTGDEHLMNHNPVPEYIFKMKTSAEMLNNYPNGPNPLAK